jgi:two-component system sensor histidine kinase BaeS
LLDDLTHLYDQTLGSLELNRQPVALHSWLSQVAAPWRETAQEKGVQWQTDFPPNLPTVEIDPDRLAQALGNIVSNAIKFTPRRGSVEIHAGIEKDSIWIRVRDSGPGIPPEEQERVFTPFYRGSVGSRFPQGMGLGLSIARDLVNAHGGSIELDSALGAGSTFTIWLPQT